MKLSFKTQESNIARKFLPILAGYGTVFATSSVLILRHQGGSYVSPFDIVVASVLLAGIAFLGFNQIKLLVDNGNLSKAGLSLDAKAHSDTLTGLMNRVAFNRVLEDQGRVLENSEMAILFFDLNRFKEVNDGLGHKVGDLLLAEVAHRLTAALPDAIALARMGGDEFAAIMPVTADIQPEVFADAVVQALRPPFRLEGHLVHTCASIGISYGNLAYDDGDELLKRADLAMYEAKSANLNSYRVFDDGMEERLSFKTLVRAELSNAITADELQMHYQPIICARTGELKSVESLLRWKSARLGDVSPGILIPIAEESGQILELSNWVIDQALIAIKTLGNVPVGVNISPVQFRQSRFVTMLTDKLLAFGVDPALLYVEITEGVLISDMAAAKRTISQLRNLGIRVYLDDFGTGYSSLNYLQSFEIDGMKIDKSFLRNIGEQSQATQIVRAVIDMGHSLNLKVVAEGIETDWQANLLRLLNCDLLQGFYFATPMSMEALIQYRLTSNANIAAFLSNEDPHSRHVDLRLMPRN
ncbi:putative bifunctional diguanylate cyclase/phosphodiesterase [Asticcacaulis benevestitus]|uniref:Diguanylate cyclase n=1 Tax=Asticcacaulis benevestitus DSM 16100 = ATCC BAA-896 TaxID=1121022 RepID=V4Q220_9CAUL|nr:EAL domain-containing protein [Asticcacaulis benevestitus]ESQ91885.1 hypothetical protein ABENE_09635 [Asticcacaulis benevestitus DSM 16100 = ATCC BAA-896]